MTKNKIKNHKKSERTVIGSKSISKLFLFLFFITGVLAPVTAFLGHKYHKITIVCMVLCIAFSVLYVMSIYGVKNSIMMYTLGYIEYSNEVNERYERTKEFEYNYKRSEIANDVSYGKSRRKS